MCNDCLCKKDELQLLNDKVDKLTTLVEQLIMTCSRMDNHVSFVNTVYDRIREPFDYIIKRVNWKKDYSSLPQLKNENI